MAKIERDTVVTTALELLDEVGIDGLTMRRLAQALDVQAPSLYWHFANKADYGLVYHRPDKTVNEASLAVVKVRMGLPGECGVERVMFDHRTSRIAAA